MIKYLIAFVGMVLIGCASAPPKPNSQNKARSPIQDSLSISKYAFIKGLDFESRNQPSVSIMLYK